MTQGRQFTNIGAGRWQATDGSGVMISLNGSSTLLTVEVPDGSCVDVAVGRDERLTDAFARALAHARSV